MTNTEIHTKLSLALIPGKADPGQDGGEVALRGHHREGHRAGLRVRRDGGERGVRRRREQDREQPRLHVRRSVPRDPGRRLKDDRRAGKNCVKENWINSCQLLINLSFKSIKLTKVAVFLVRVQGLTALCSKSVIQLN